MGLMQTFNIFTGIYYVYLFLYKSSRIIPTKYFKLWFIVYQIVLSLDEYN